MKKKDISVIIGFIILFVIAGGCFFIASYYEEKDEKISHPYLTEMAVDALNKGDFGTAYGAIDKMKSQKYYKGEKKDDIDKLNNRIVQNEIADIMDNYEGKKAFGKILFAINERTAGENKIEMITTALKMSEAVGDDELSENLIEYQKETLD